MSMHFEFHTPQHPLLAELIAGFYFLADTEPGELHYQTFPNNYSILSVLKNSVVSFDGNRAECTVGLEPIEKYYESILELLGRPRKK